MTGHMTRGICRLAVVLALGVLVTPVGAQILGVNQTITVVDSGTACVTAPAACATFTVDNATPAVTLNITGTWTGTITFEGTNDDTLWTAITAINIGSGAQATTTTANGLFGINNAGVTKVRARATATITGSALVTAAKGQGVARTLTLPAGTGGATFKAGGVIYADPSVVANAADTNFVSNTVYNLPGNTLVNNGDALRFEIMWNFSADTGAKTMQCNIGYSAWTAAGGFTGGVNVLSFGSSVASQSLVASATMRRTGAAAGDLTSQGIFTVLNSWAGGVNNGSAGLGAWNAPTPILCHVKNAGAVAGSVTMKNFRIFYEPAPS